MALEAEVADGRAKSSLIPVQGENPSAYLVEGRHDFPLAAASAKMDGSLVFLGDVELSFFKDIRHADHIYDF